MSELFFILGGWMVCSAIAVITLTNPVHSAIYLVITFLSAAIIMLGLGADFLGFVFILVYVGAIAIFFLLVIMLLNVKHNPATFSMVKYAPLSSFVGFVFVLEFILPFTKLTSSNFETYSEEIYWQHLSNFAYVTENIDLFGQLLYTEYFVFFLILGLILLIALLGAVLLTYTPTTIKTKS